MIEHRKVIPKVKDVFPASSSIFSKMDYDFTYDKAYLDTLFVVDFGLKSISPLVEYILGTEDELTSEQLTILSAMLLGKYKAKWDRDLAVLAADYDPLHNYLDEYSEEGEVNSTASGTKTGTRAVNDNLSDNVTTTRTDNLSESSTRTDNLSESSTRTDNLSENTTRTDDLDNSMVTNRGDTVTGANDHSRYGMNSAEAVPVSSDDSTTGTTTNETVTGENNGTQTFATTNTGTQTDAKTNTGTQTNAKTNTGTQSITDAEMKNRTIQESNGNTSSSSGKDEKEKSGYHRGNIGNISTQKLILEEIDLWRWNFIQEVLNDARDFLTIQVYCL